MRERTTGPCQGANDKRVYVGALISIEHYVLLAEEADQANVSRSEILRRALAEHYQERQAKEA